MNIVNLSFIKTFKRVSHIKTLFFPLFSAVVSYYFTEKCKRFIGSLQSASGSLVACTSAFLIVEKLTVIPN
jgi:hypothetical protein